MLLPSFCRGPARAATRKSKNPKPPTTTSPRIAVIGYGTHDQVPAKALCPSRSEAHGAPRAAAETVPMPEQGRLRHPTEQQCTARSCGWGWDCLLVTYRRRSSKSSTPFFPRTGVLAVTFSRHETAGYRAGRRTASHVVMNPGSVCPTAATAAGLPLAPGAKEGPRPRRWRRLSPRLRSGSQEELTQVPSIGGRARAVREGSVPSRATTRKGTSLKYVSKRTGRQ